MAKSQMSGPLIVDRGILSRQHEDWDDDGEISITSGIVTISSNLCNTAIALTLPDPTSGAQEDGGDDFKYLQIVDTTGAAHTVTPTTPFGNGGADEAVATFSGVVGDSIKLRAYGGYWYIVGKHQVTVAAA